MGKEKVGPILGIVGSAILLVGGFIGFGVQALVEAQLGLLGVSWADIGFDPSILMIRVIITIIVAILGLIGAIIAITGKKAGTFILLIMGIVALIGSFVPIGVIDLGIYGSIPVTLIYPFFYVESILMLVGGILGLVLKE